VECKSIFPSGFSPSLIYGLPTYIPLQVWAL
jgi:hypothetical protein